MEAAPNYGAFIEALQTWEQLGRRLQANVPLQDSRPDYGAFIEALQTWEKLTGGLQRDVENAIAVSDKELWPLRDPLKLNLGEHRWLSRDREESYSDWLAWILQGMSGADEILPLFGLGDDCARRELGKASIRRELPSEWGRTDVVVRFGDRGFEDRGLFIIEVKVGPTGKDLADQLKRYEEWACDQGGGLKLFALLGTVKPAHDTGSFVFTDWLTLCRRLRRYANGVKGPDLLRAAAILIFCGAVEENVAELSVRRGQFHAMATVNHLRRWRREIMSEEGTDKEREFLVTGAKSYLAVEEAMEQFRQRVQDQIATLVAGRLSEINKACEIDWTVDDIKEYSQRNPDNYNLGKQIAVDGFGGLYFYLKLWHERYEVYVDLYRRRMDLAGDLWKRAASNTIKGNDIWFLRDVPEDGIPEFGERLSEAIDKFVKFIGDAGGLKRYLP